MLQGDSGGSPLQQLFSEGEWRSTCKLPILGAHGFGLCQSNNLLICHLHQCWGQAKVDVISSSGWKISSEIVPVVVSITHGMEDESQGMMTTFCHHDQAKVESSEVLSTLCQ